MKTLIVGMSTLVMGIAVAYGAETSVVPPPVNDDPSSQTLPKDADVRQEQSYERQTLPDGSVREERRTEEKSKAKKKIEEKTTY